MHASNELTTGKVKYYRPYFQISYFEKKHQLSWRIYVYLRRYKAKKSYRLPRCSREDYPEEHTAHYTNKVHLCLLINQTPLPHHICQLALVEILKVAPTLSSITRSLVIAETSPVTALWLFRRICGLIFFTLGLGSVSTTRRASG